MKLFAPLIVLVTGGRHHNQPELIESALDRALRKTNEDGQWMAIVHGGERGADRHAQSWAARKRKEGWRVGWWSKPADWSSGKSAGPRRNKEMILAILKMPGVNRYVLAFPQGSKEWPAKGGTADCVRQARENGLRVGIVKDDGEICWDRTSGPGSRT